MVGVLFLENADHDPRHHMLTVILVPGEGLLDFSPTQRPYGVHRPFGLSSNVFRLRYVRQQCHSQRATLIPAATLQGLGASRR